MKAEPAQGQKKAALKVDGGKSSNREKASPVDQARAPVLTIAALAEEIQTCMICPLHKGRKISTAGEGGAKPTLLIVGDWLVHDPEGAGIAVLGEQQDLMLNKMMGAISLEMSTVFVTNVIKCSVDGSVRPDSTHIETCLSYLKQQITILSPRVICTMGAVASQALLGSSLPLIRLRGRFHQLQMGSGRMIPVMPTFHPSYLLKNPEMKKPTWEDLQAVKKMLQTAR